MGTEIKQLLEKNIQSLERLKILLTDEEEKIEEDDVDYLKYVRDEIAEIEKQYALKVAKLATLMEEMENHNAEHQVKE